MDQNGIPTVEDFASNQVVDPNQSQIVRQSLYDHVIYPAAGAQSLAMFQLPVGQGVTSAPGATAGTVKTLHDTNMMLGGQLSNGVQFMVDSIEIAAYPGSVSTANTFTIDNLTFFLTAASAVPSAQVDDVSALMQSGMLELNVIGVNMLREVPLMRFPPKAYLALNAAIATNSATVGEVGVANVHADGRPYYLTPRITLQPLMAFEVALKWPGLVPMPSGFNARIGVFLDGFLRRGVA